MAQRQFLCGRLLNFPLLLYLPEQPYGHAQVLDSCGDGIPISQPHIFMVRFGQLSTAMALQPSNLRPQATTHPIAAVASSSSSQSQPSVTMGFQHYNLQQPHAPAGLKGSHPETNNPKPSRWDNADSTKIIQTGPSYVTYEFKGVRCQHTKPCSNTPSSAPSPLSPEHSGETTRLTVDETLVDDSCASLQAQGILFFKPLDLFYCRLHNDFIPYPDFQHRINRLHGNTLPGGNNVVRSFYAHVETFYASISPFRGHQSINKDSGNGSRNYAF
jgi:hypothetical protein